MAGPKNGEIDSRAAEAGQNDHAHSKALHADVYTAPLNHRVIKSDGTIEQHPAPPGPKLTDLSIDTTPGHVVVHDVARQGATAQERREAAKRDMPTSNDIFRALVKGGVEFMDMNDGGFNIQMRNALNEANQSDKSMKSGHAHVDNVLKYANSKLNDSDYTLRRKGNIVEIWDAHESTKHPAGRWNLDKNAPEK
jgi:hypothetical protein